MKTIFLHDKAIIERFLLQDPELHIYSLGDLDPFFWPYTCWYALVDDGEPVEIALLYTGLSVPTFLGLSTQTDLMGKLIASIEPLLPSRFYAHLSPGVEEALSAYFTLDPYGEHHKMTLRNPEAVLGVDCSLVVGLQGKDLKDIQALYAASYPGNWFDQRMLDTGQYFGLREDGQLVSIAGIHVYSEAYRVAAIGNVTTHPACRNRGYGTLVAAGLCQSLLKKIDHIGLNVKGDNFSALTSYRKLGFEVTASYEEYMVRRN
jgi:GNAT superfamily N-acetyltransferase